MIQGMIAYSEGSIDEAIELFEQVRSLSDSDNFTVTEILAEAYAKNNEYDKSLELLLELKSKGYATYQMMINIAILYEQTDQLDPAESTLLDLCSQYPERYEAYMRLAFLEADKQQRKANEDRDYSKMKEYYETAYSLYDPDESADEEMERLSIMMQELEEGNWFE